MVLQSFSCQLPISFLCFPIIPNCRTNWWVYLINCSVNKLPQSFIYLFFFSTFQFYGFLMNHLLYPFHNMIVGWFGSLALRSKTPFLPDLSGYPLYSACCCCLLLKQVLYSHQYKPSNIFTGNHIYNTNATNKTE